MLGNYWDDSRVLLNDGAGHMLTRQGALPIGYQWAVALALADIDGDGDLDLFSSPDNPTSQIVPDIVFDGMLEMAAEAGCFVAVDYAYRAQYFDEPRPAHFAASPARHPNLVKIHSNSKWARGLGRRLG